ncbi:MAG: hypothetical protein ACREA0_31720, partial [bacterium]
MTVEHEDLAVPTLAHVGHRPRYESREETSGEGPHRVPIEPSVRYRADIDGLRAVAVIPVVLF